MEEERKNLEAAGGAVSVALSLAAPMTQVEDGADGTVYFVYNNVRYFAVVQVADDQQDLI
jgi:hypothetical protein